MKKLPAVIAHLYTKVVIAVGFGIFYFEDMKAMGRFFKSLAGVNAKLSNSVMNAVFMQYIFLFCAAILFTMPIVGLVKKSAQRSEAGTAAVGTAGIIINAALLLTSAILLLNSTNNPFLYFRF